MDLFPGPARQMVGHPTGNLSGNMTGDLGGTRASPPEHNGWDGALSEGEAWLGWFKPPGVVSLPSHFHRNKAPQWGLGQSN
jgi:hypothetical protein